MYFENLKRPKFRGIYYFEILKRFTLILAIFMLKNNCNGALASKCGVL